MPKKSVKQIYIPPIRSNVSKRKTATFITKQKNNGSWLVLEKHSNIIMKVISEKSEAQSYCDKLNNLK
jgi:hypothetical protein